MDTCRAGPDRWGTRRRGKGGRNERHEGGKGGERTRPREGRQGRKTRGNQRQEGGKAQQRGRGKGGKRRVQSRATEKTRGIHRDGDIRQEERGGVEGAEWGSEGQPQSGGHEDVGRTNRPGTGGSKKEWRRRLGRNGWGGPGKGDAQGANSQYTSNPERTGGRKHPHGGWPTERIGWGEGVRDRREQRDTRAARHRGGAHERTRGPRPILEGTKGSNRKTNVASENKARGGDKGRCGASKGG